MPVKLGSVDITPLAPTQLFGFGGRDASFEGRPGALEANFLLLPTSDGGAPVLAVAVDLLYGGEVGRELKRLSGESLRVAVLGSHTHYAPGIDRALPTLGVTDPSYPTWVATAVLEALAVTSPLPEGATIGYAQRPAPNLVVNRRLLSFGTGVNVPSIGRIVNAPNPSGSRDAVLRVAVVRAGDAVVGVLWSFACHPVSEPEPASLTASFPGRVREALRQRFPDVPVLYFQGFSGDIRPHFATRRPPTKVSTWKPYIAALGRRFVPPTERKSRAWTERLAAFVNCAVDEASSALGEALSARWERAVLPWPAGSAGAREPTMTMICLSAGIRILCVNAEVVSSRAIETTNATHGQVLPASCADEVIGYWPTDDMLEFGGYEADASRRHFPPVDWEGLGGPDEAWRLLRSRLDD